MTGLVLPPASVTLPSSSACGIASCCSPVLTKIGDSETAECWLTLAGRGKIEAATLASVAALRASALKVLPAVRVASA